MYKIPICFMGLLQIILVKFKDTKSASHLVCIEIRLRVTGLALLHFQCVYWFWACGDLSI